MADFEQQGVGVYISLGASQSRQQAAVLSSSAGEVLHFPDQWFAAPNLFAVANEVDKVTELPAGIGSSLTFRALSVDRLGGEGVDFVG